MNGDEKRVLVIDDNEQDADMTARCLRRAGIYRIELARDGIEGLDMLLHRGLWMALPPEPFDLVLLDVKMPRLSGFEVLEQIRATPGLQPPPIVMWTSSSLADDRAQAHALGASDYRVKPIDFGEFRQALADIARRWLPAGSNPPDGTPV